MIMYCVGQHDEGMTLWAYFERNETLLSRTFYLLCHANSLLEIYDDPYILVIKPIFALR